MAFAFGRGPFSRRRCLFYRQLKKPEGARKNAFVGAEKKGGNGRLTSQANAAAFRRFYQIAVKMVFGRARRSSISGRFRRGPGPWKMARYCRRLVAAPLFSQVRHRIGQGAFDKCTSIRTSQTFHFINPNALCALPTHIKPQENEKRNRNRNWITLPAAKQARKLFLAGQ